MENFNYFHLNEMIQYIEENLENEISMNDLAKIVGVSPNSLQRIFTFIIGVSITEYIKRRRLSKAFEEIKNTNRKIMDIALKYQYNSIISFDRAFKRIFGITPLECREKDISYQQFPIVVFKSDNTYYPLHYEIKYIKEKEIYCYKIQTEKRIDLLYKIRELYRYLKEKGIHEKLKNEEQYAISLYENGIDYYMVGSKTQYTSKEKMKIPAGKYAIFEVGTREQKDIIKLKKDIYTKWCESTNLTIDKYFSFEYYTGKNCYLCIPIIA